MMSNIDESSTLLRDCNGHKHQQQHQQHIAIIVKAEYEPILASDDALTLDELLLYVDDPWWQKLRRTLLCTFWLVFFLILSTACLLAYMQHDKQCPVAIRNVESSTTGAVATLTP